MLTPQLPLVEQTRTGGLGDCAMEGFDAGRLRISGVIVNEKTSLTAEAVSVFESSNDVHSIAITVLISIMAS